MSIVVVNAFRQPLLLAVLVTVALVQGCSAVPAAKEAYDKGWRQARVVDASVGAESIPGLVNDCRAQTSPDDPRRFALMLYQDRNQGATQFVAAVPQGLGVREERIYQVNVKDCNSVWYRVR